MARTLYIILLLIAHLPFSGLRAQGSVSRLRDLTGEDAGRTTAHFLTLPISAAQLARNPVSFPANNDPTDLPTAPSGTAFFTDYEFAVTHLEWLMGLRQQYVAACIPIHEIGTVGFYSRVFTLGHFSHARTIDELPSSPAAAEMATGASFARGFLDGRGAAGLSAGFLESHLDGANAYALTGTFDGHYNPLSWMRLQMAVRNVGNSLKHGLDAAPQPLQVGAAVKATSARLPFAEGVPVTCLDASLGVLKSGDEALRVGISGELEMRRSLRVRAGYEMPYGSTPHVDGISGGIGFAAGSYAIDAGIKFQSRVFGPVWSATIRYSTEDVRQRSPQEYLRIARRYFNNEKHGRAIYYARKAIALRPRLWEGHELIHLSTHRQRKVTGDELVVVFTGNLARNIEDAARQSAAVRRLRRDNRNAITVECGNAVGVNSTLEQGIASGIVREKAGYDVACLGPGEIAYGLDRYLERIAPSRTDLICTNLNSGTVGSISDATIVTRMGLHIAVLSAIPERLVPDLRLRLTMRPALEALSDRLESIAVRNCDLRVVVLHGSLSDAEQYARNLPSADIILWATPDPGVSQPWAVESTPIIPVSFHGDYAGMLRVRFDPHQRSFSWEHRMVAFAGIEEHRAATRALKRHIPRIFSGEKKERIDRNDYADGVFALVSNRDGYARTYLKVLGKHAEFPMSDTLIPAGFPRVSIEGNRFLYIENPEDSLRARAVVTMLDGAKPARLTTPGAAADACLSHDGSWAYVSVRSEEKGSTDLYRIPSRNGSAMPVAAWSGSSERYPAAAPDGSMIAFCSNSSGHWRVYVADPAGDVPICLTDARANHIEPAFSPDSRYLAWLSDRHSTPGNYDLWVYSRTEGLEYRMTNSADLHEFCWIPGRPSIVVSAGSQRISLDTVNILTAQRGRLVQGSGKNLRSFDERRPKAVQISGETMIAYVRESSERRELYWVRPDGNDNRRISRSRGQEWLE